MIENYLVLPAQAQNPTNLTSIIPHWISSPTKILVNYSTLTKRATKVQTTPFPRNSSIMISVSKHLHSITKAAAIDHATRKHLIDLMQTLQTEILTKANFLRRKLGTTL